jgi:hypothetical protein
LRGRPTVSKTPSRQRITAVKNLISLVTAALLLMVCEPVFAQAPTYAPYGAWRGRIRYVEGPWRTRSTIHWGNGITPTGGQVLIQGLTSAENVLTNPDFLGKLSGLREAKPDEKAAARSKEITATISDIRAQHAEIAKLNQSVLAKWGLEPTKPKALVQSSQTPGAFDPNAAEKPAELIDKIATTSSKIGPLVERSKVQAGQTLQLAELLDRRKDSLTLDGGQKELLADLIDYTRTVAREFNSGPAATVDGDLVGSIKSFARLFENLDKGYREFSQIAVDLRSNATKLAEHPFRDDDAAVFAVNAIAAADRIDEGLKRCGPPPSIPTGAFDNVRLADAAPPPPPLPDLNPDPSEANPFSPDATN